MDSNTLGMARQGSMLKTVRYDYTVGIDGIIRA